MAKTPNLNLNVPDYRDLRWDVPVNENWNLIDTAVAGKQDIIPDLAEIRSNAQAGNDIIPQVDANTQSIEDLTVGLASRANVSLNNLDEVGEARFTSILNETGSELDYTGTTLSLNNANGNTLSSVTIKSTPDLDNKSIKLNGSSQLQTVGVINQNNPTTAIKTWTGTKAQYDAIESKDPNTLYNVIDDTDVSLTILEALYPVGSVYITTADTCPLSTLISGSTWTLRSSGVVTSVNTSVPVNGNGMTLGVTKDGTTTNTLVGHYGSWNGVGGTNLFVDNYNSVIGSGQSHTNVPGAIGITTDSSKSGIVGTVTSTILSVNIFERTA